MAREGKKLRKLRKAVNAYLLAQNSCGYKDAPHPGDKERCKEARQHLCGVVYDLNERAAKKKGK